MSGVRRYDELADARASARQRAEGGDLTGARALLEEAIETGKLQLGHTHPRLAPLMVDLATIATELGNRTEAQSQLRQAHAIVAASAGPDHARALAIEARLAAITHRLGEPSDHYDRHLIDAATPALGADHHTVRAARHRLGSPVPSPAASTRQPPPRRSGSESRSITLSLATEETFPGAASHAVAGSSQPRTAPDDPAPPPRYSPPDPTHAGNPPVWNDHPAIDADHQALYVPSAVAAGVYDRRAEAEGVYIVAPPGAYQEPAAWAESPAPPAPARPGSAPSPPAPTTPRVPAVPPVMPGVPAAPPPIPPTPIPPTLPGLSRRGPSSGFALVAGLCATAVLAIAVIISQVTGSAGRDGAALPREATGALGSTQPVGPTAAASNRAPPRSTPPGPDGARPPTELALRDRAGSVTLTWHDPANGTVPFVVAGSRAGTVSRPLQTVPAGRTTSTIYGLNSRYDYCFTVTAVYSITVTAASIKVCTHRLSTSR